MASRFSSITVPAGVDLGRKAAPTTSRRSPNRCGVGASATFPSNVLNRCRGPTVLLFNELTLFTGTSVVSVADYVNGRDLTRELALARSKRQLAQGTALTRWPPPRPHRGVADYSR